MLTNDHMESIARASLTPGIGLVVSKSVAHDGYLRLFISWGEAPPETLDPKPRQAIKRLEKRWKESVPDLLCQERRQRVGIWLRYTGRQLRHGKCPPGQP